METMIVSLKNEKAKQILIDLAAIDLIEITEQKAADLTGNLSELRHKIKSRMTEDQIDEQLQNVRTEWQRNI